VEPEGLGGSSGAVVLAMYGSQSAEGVWVMGSEEVRDSWEIREGGLGVYFWSFYDFLGKGWFPV
jgi:hypothetical protein